MIDAPKTEYCSQRPIPEISRDSLRLGNVRYCNAYAGDARVTSLLSSILVRISANTAPVDAQPASSVLEP